MSFSADAYGPRFRPLLEIDRARPLDSGQGNREARAALEALSVPVAFAHAQLEDKSMASACLAGVWLLHDFLEESHRISQAIPSSEGSFWHGIMHRREGDYSNAKYWFRRAVEHPVFEALLTSAQQAASEATGPAAEQLAQLTSWDPYLMVDVSEAAVRRGDAQTSWLIAVQRREWELLFDHCYRHAVKK